MPKKIDREVKDRAARMVRSVCRGRVRSRRPWSSSQLKVGVHRTTLTGEVFTYVGPFSTAYSGGGSDTVQNRIDPGTRRAPINCGTRHSC